MSSEKLCLIDTNIFQACPKNCKSVLKGNFKQIGLEKSCIAKEKLNAFLEGISTFNVGISAFYQANPDILNSFIKEKPENQELVSYYLSISEPEAVSDIVESLTDSVAYELFKNNYDNYLKLKEDYKTRNTSKNFFKIKGNQYWQGVSFAKICSIILYSIREKNEYALVSQFLVLLPQGVVSHLQEFSGINDQEEKNLYLSLGDSIYELPIQSPGVYPHMLKLFEDDLEIFMILSTMEELVKRQKQILSITGKLIEYYEEHSFGLTIQNIYSELIGLESELVTEILNQLKDKSVISDSQKDMLNMVFQRGNIDFLKTLRGEILRT
ncbi:hypothetical protein [Leptospira sp. GIMC2001]|uniref:hypothetical protein n=1 Tax=Leptospira sp. GIMC2001 TaxID=1513297 RepID=UPI0023494E51|nr:hypothetical protein [Leptospira sp. GIMC2001]WCL50111.1 hypothetical protein O4O04_04640 [Leptospira sp. GIMC2001]